MKPTASTELLSQRTDPRCLALVPGFGAAIRRGIATLLMVAAICALTAVTAHADTFTVNSVWDMVDYTPGDGVCDTDPDPLYVVCTLRAAVQEANAAGAGTIVLPAGTYYLYIAGSDEDAAATGDLDITSNLIIAGSDTDQSIISAYYNMNDRVLHIIGTVHPTISHVWIEGGRCTTATAAVSTTRMAALRSRT